MFKTFQKLYLRHIGNSFFRKNMLIYTIISIVPIITLTFIVSNSISALLLEKDSIRNNLILNNISNYFNEKYELVNMIIKQTYTDTDVKPEIADFLEKKIEKTDIDYLQYQRIFTKYFYSFFSRDPDIRNVAIYKNLDKTFYVLSKNFERTFDEKDINLSPQLKQTNENAPSIHIFPTHLPDYNKETNVYTLSINMKILGTNQNSGLLFFDFDPVGISKTLLKLGFTQSQGNVYILTDAGEFIYDSSNRYYGQKYPHLDILKSKSHSAIIDGESIIINLSTEERSGIIVANVIPKREILKDIYGIKLIIYLVTFVCILTAILFTLISASHFSKRIRSITKVMNGIWAGDLSIRISNNHTPNDEVNAIARSFNRMCDNLEEHINKVYLSQIKQKSAELSALQSQINPHFLYNTLEAIRMKAITANDKEIGNMIYILGKLFRSMVKEDTFVWIEDEIEYCKLYLELFKIRYGSKLSVTFRIEEQVLHYGIIKHLLQPTIENYVIHGFDLRKAENLIEIKAYQVEEMIYFQIIDNGIGIHKEKLDQLKQHFEAFDILNRTSIGLRNVNERIKLIYGSEYGVDIESIIDKGTIVTLKISAKTKEELIKHVQGINRR